MTETVMRLLSNSALVEVMFAAEDAQKNLNLSAGERRQLERVRDDARNLLYWDRGLYETELRKEREH